MALRPGGSGVQTYIRELLSELTRVTDATLAAIVQRDAVGELPAEVEPVSRRTSEGALRAVSSLRGAGPSDLVHGLNVALPLHCGHPRVVTVHDMSYFDAPWAYSRARAAGGRLMTSVSLRRADAVIAVSTFTAERVRALSGREAVVVPLAPSRQMHAPAPAEVARARAAYGLPERFVLHVGTIEPRKDVPLLAEACREVPVPLVLAGSRLSGTELPGGPQVLGYVPGADLPGLYGAAALVAYPSRYEGFGLPPLEAMACGAPVVATAVPALVEVVGGAAELVPAGSVDLLAVAIRDLLADEDRRQDLAGAGRERVGSLSWRRTAEATVGVYRSLGVPA